MKKIILAAAAAIAVAFFSASSAEARSISENTQYSNPIEELFGGFGWDVTPQPRIRSSQRHSRVFRHENDYTYSNASPSIVAYGHYLQNMGYRVSEHPAFGGVHHVHHGWAHYAGRAIDVNVGRGVKEAHSLYGHRFDILAEQARAAGYTVFWRVAGHYDHMHIQR